jgi:hypothetical protein
MESSESAIIEPPGTVDPWRLTIHLWMNRDISPFLIFSTFFPSMALRSK